MEEKLRNLITESLIDLGIESGEVVLEHPGDPAMGDYSTNVAMAFAKVLKQNPKELAQKIAANLNENKISEVERIEVAGPGFINFYLSREFFTSYVREIIKKGDDFGKNRIGEGKKVIVEFSSPNIAKPFTVGHLRSTIIGDCIAKIFSFSGYEVLRDNHLGDWGTQFGKMIVAIKKYGDESQIESSERPVKNLVDLYVKFHTEAEKDPSLEDEARAWFTKLEQGDEEARRLWQKCIDWSLIEFKAIYDRLGVNFDMMLGESFFEDKMPAVIKDLSQKDFYKESEGAKLIFFADEKYPPLMIEKKDGSTLYATRDLATDKYRKETWDPDLVVNEVGIEQSLYFRQLFEAEEMLGYFPKEKRKHVAHGLYRFRDGKMSTRKGNVIWLEDILNEGVARAGKINPESSEEVGIGAIKFNDLKNESSKDIVFNWDDIVALEGDTGPYIQYANVRAKSVLAKAEEAGIDAKFNKVPSQVFAIEKLLYKFPEVVEISLKNYAPHTIAQYVLSVSREFNSFYAGNKILGSEDDFSPYKIAITRATSVVLENGLYLLGIKTPEKM
jgi:arginyl-tRNA synthetase